MARLPLGADLASGNQRDGAAVDSDSCRRALAVVRSDPRRHLRLATTLEGSGSLRPVLPCELITVEHEGVVSGIVHVGRTLTPAGLRPETIPRLRDRLAAVDMTRASAILGPDADVDLLLTALPPTLAARLSHRQSASVLEAGTGTVTGPDQQDGLRVGTVDERTFASFVEASARGVSGSGIASRDIAGRVRAGAEAWAALVRRHRAFGAWDRQGCCVFRAEVWPVGGLAMEIRGVWLAPHLRGRGLASALMAQLTRQLQAMRTGAVCVLVMDSNLPAMRAYRRAGFTPVTSYRHVTLARRPRAPRGGTG